MLVHHVVWATTALLSVGVRAHMEISWPYPFHSRFNPANTYLSADQAPLTWIDYSMTVRNWFEIRHPNGAAFDLDFRLCLVSAAWYWRKLPLQSTK